MGGEGVDAERVVLDQHGQQLVGPAADVGLPHPDLHLLVEQLHHRHRVGHAAVDAGDRDGAAAAHRVDGGVQGGEAVQAGLLHHRLGDRVGQQTGHLLDDLRTGGAVGLHADGVDHGVRTAPAGGLADDVADAADLVGVVEVQRLGPEGLHALEPLGHPVDGEDAVSGADAHPRGHVADRAGAEDEERAALGDVGVLQRLPRGRQHVGEEEEAVVGVLVRHLDRQEVREGDAEVLRLPAGDLAVELAVAEEARAGAVLVVLRGLALAVEALPAHPARAAADVERYDDAVAYAEVGDGRADLLDDAHRLVADDVAGLHERGEGLVEVQVGAAQAGGGDLDDRVGRLLDPRVGYVGDLHVVDALPGDCLHRDEPPSVEVSNDSRTRGSGRHAGGFEARCARTSTTETWARTSTTEAGSGKS